MKSKKPMTGIQEAVYITYRFDCSERNTRGRIFWSIRRGAGHLFDMRGIREKIAYRKLEVQRSHVRTAMVVAKFEARPKQTRRLMAVEAPLPMLLRAQAE